MITLFTICTVLLAMTCSFLLSQGYLRAVYLLGIVVQCGYIALNYIFSAVNWTILLLAIPSFWSIFCNIRGLRRLWREGKDKP